MCAEKMRLDTAQKLCLLDLFGRSGDIRKFGKRDTDARRRSLKTLN